MCTLILCILTTIIRHCIQNERWTSNRSATTKIMPKIIINLKFEVPNDNLNNIMSKVIVKWLVGWPNNCKFTQNIQILLFRIIFQPAFLQSNLVDTIVPKHSMLDIYFVFLFGLKLISLHQYLTKRIGNWSRSSYQAFKLSSNFIVG